jgi:hypothetical protein
VAKNVTSEPVVLDRERAPASDTAKQPTMVIAAGRGKVGKSVTLRWMIERALARGDLPVIADADRTNATLSAFFPLAIRPASAEDEDVRLFLNQLADDQIGSRANSFLDLGGGDLTLKQWTRDLDLSSFLASYGIRPVLLHLLGSDIDDLAYLRDLETVFAPPHTAIVLNAGMVPSGRSPLTAFTPILEHAVFKAAVERGAKVIRMPRLGCMQEVDARRLSFADADHGDSFPPTARQLVRMWRREMEKAFETVTPWIE